MQRTQPTNLPLDEDEPRAPKGGLNLRLGFLITGALIVGLLLFLSMSRGGETVSPDPAAVEDSVVDPDAVFQQLRADLNKAVRLRDQNALQELLVADSEIYRRVEAEIRQLRTDNTLDLTEVESLSVVVLQQSDDHIRLKERVLLHPCFMTEDGEDITDSPATVAQRGEWELQLINNRWVFASGSLQGQQVIDDSSARC